MKNLKSALVLAAAALSAGLCAGQSAAGISQFNMVAGVPAPGVDVLLDIRVSDRLGYAYDFVLQNNSSQGIITGVYFEQGFNHKLSGVGTPDGPASYLPASLVPDLPWADAKSSHTVDQAAGLDILADGLMPGQTQVFSFRTDVSKVSLQDLEDVLATDDYKLAIRVQGLGPDTQAPAWGLATEMTSGSLPPATVTTVPTPSSAASLAVLTLAAVRRRRG